MARDYAKDRQIFGRPLASYQAIKHKLADVLVGIELARSSAYYAGWAAVNGTDDLPQAAAAARLMAIDAFERAARDNIQVHGGIGYTFDANCHFYYRRERTLALSLGGRECWADRLIAHSAGVRLAASPGTDQRAEAA
jgi:acyl-CoA dehydrogenase